MHQADGYVGILAADIHFPENGSLKDKRQRIRSIKANLTRKFGASVAEVGYHDLWQRSRLLVSISSAASGELERALDLVREYLEQCDCHVSSVQREIIKLEAQ